ncbi:MAG TPA: hypothetical protein VLL25_12960, partial [Acidimicrobiales bacterium]|nr:hypothetical protein [Acidimicrobiales bacterium]
YLVTNTGNITLNPVTVSDNKVSPVACPQTSLTPKQSMTCTASAGMATRGQHTNTATVTGQGVGNNAKPVGPPVTAKDTANYFGEAPDITAVKQRNGQQQPTVPGLLVPVGSTLTSPTW